ncbi:ATPase involved in chromosome partitioning [Oleiphilus messinensis]|uniref:ATPase involved in chromosome partitioning n=1 Tax=Oleiphilus messinensis TaxID=141451 RepID=A0A1Y0ID67_9GAMM|nr:MinD/ParA family protein [Oleiphilus messinensis]ARU58401.1 ATPase involved in chromosome partitioning [Oleiphilus messinensis]
MTSEVLKHGIQLSDSVDFPATVSFTSGKGGVGKTSITVNTAIALARSGKKVCIFDADTGLANVNILLGITPEYTLEHLFLGQKSISEIMVQGPGGIDIVPGASGVLSCLEMDAGKQRHLKIALAELEPRYDYILVDTAAGIAKDVLHFVAATQIAVVVITPEPTSLTDAFSLIKVLKRGGYKRQIYVVVNMVSGLSKAKEVFRRFQFAVKKYIAVDVAYMGSIWRDESIRTGLELQRPVALLPESDPSARSFYRLASTLETFFARPGLVKRSFARYWSRVMDNAARSVANAQVPVTPRSETGEVSPNNGEPDPRHRISTPQSNHSSQASKRGVDLIVERENEWTMLQVRACELIKEGQVPPQQVGEFVLNMLQKLGETERGIYVDLALALLRMVRVDTVSPDQQHQLLSEIHGLLNHSISHQVASGVTNPASTNFSDARPGVESMCTERPATETIASENMNVSSHYEGQAKSSNPWLESLKYAALVDHQK